MFISSFLMLYAAEIMESRTRSQIMGIYPKAIIAQTFSKYKQKIRRYSEKRNLLYPQTKKRGGAGFVRDTVCSSAQMQKPEIGHFVN